MNALSPNSGPLSIDAVLPFATLDFPGRATVSVGEIAKKLGVSDQHILNLIDDGSFTGLNLKGAKAKKSKIRVPADEYRRFVLARLTGPAHSAFLGELPEKTLRQIRDKVRQ